MKRQIIRFDHDKCTGCGDCIPACPEGAIQIIDGKARLISDLFCDGLGACLKSCPHDAILTEEREAEPYEENKVMVNIVKQGGNVIEAHLRHLKDHGDEIHLAEAMKFLKENGIQMKKVQGMKKEVHIHGNGCPGSRIIDRSKEMDNNDIENPVKISSQLKQWPVQLHLISPGAPYFKKSDVLLSADCVAYSAGNFHNDFLKGKSLIIACPKLDSNTDIYSEKIKALIEESEINTLTVMIMEVPCCGGLLQLAAEAAKKAGRKIPVKKITLSLKGLVIKEEWVS